MDKVLQACNLIIWNECTMVHKETLKALDCLLRDINNGALVLLSSDFRQPLPIYHV